MLRQQGIELDLKGRQSSRQRPRRQELLFSNRCHILVIEDFLEKQHRTDDVPRGLVRTPTIEADVVSYIIVLRKIVNIDFVTGTIRAGVNRRQAFVKTSDRSFSTTAHATLCSTSLNASLGS